MHTHACMHVLTHSGMWHAKQEIIMAKFNIEERLNIELLHIVKRTMEWLLLPRVYFTWSGPHNTPAFLSNTAFSDWSVHGSHWVNSSTSSLTGLSSVAALVLMCYLLVTSFRTQVLWREDIFCLSLFILHLNFS